MVNAAPHIQSNERSSPPQLPIRNPSGPQITSRGVLVEGGLAALNCSATVVAGLATFRSGVASPLTGGSSLLVTGLAYSATAATGMSCGVALMRTYNEIADPQANVALDKQEWYKRPMMVVDGVSLVGVGVSAVAAARLMSVLSRSGVKLGPAARGTVPRHLRKRLAGIMTRLKNPGASNRSIKEMVRSGSAPSRQTNTEISAAALHQLKDAVAAGLSFGASSLDGNIRSWTVYLLETRDANGIGV